MHSCTFAGIGKYCAQREICEPSFHCHCSSIGCCMLRKLSNKHTDHRYHSQSATIGVPSCCILRSSHCKLAASRLATISALTLFSSTTGLPLMKCNCNDRASISCMCVHVCVCVCMFVHVCVSIHTWGGFYYPYYIVYIMASVLHIAHTTALSIFVTP